MRSCSGVAIVAAGLVSIEGLLGVDGSVLSFGHEGMSFVFYFLCLLSCVWI